MSCARDSGGDSWFYNHYDTVRRLLLQTFPTPKLTERPSTTKLFIYKVGDILRDRIEVFVVC